MTLTQKFKALTKLVGKLWADGELCFVVLGNSEEMKVDCVGVLEPIHYDALHEIVDTIKAQRNRMENTN